MRYISFTIFFFICGLLQSQSPVGDVLIKNGHVLTITKGELAETDVLIQKGKISVIGKNIEAPPGVREVDASGMYVMPGIIDAHSHIGIDAVNEGTNVVTAEVFTGDAINPFDISIYRALAGGVTVSHAMHGSANAIGGQCETIKHRWGVLDPGMFKMQGALRTIKFALGENPMRTHGEGTNVIPRTRMGVEHVIRKAFSEAKNYAESWNSYERQKQTNSRVIAPIYDLRLSTLAEVLSGEVVIHCHSYRADEIYMLLNVCRDFGINKITFQHVNEGFKVAPELAEFGAYASVFSDWWAYKFEVYYSTAYNAAILMRNGVITSINSDSGELIRHLYHEASKTQKYGGLSANEALSLITINAAIQLGIEDRVGSLEVGKDGDIAIFKGHPLSVYAVPQLTIVDGIVRFDIENDVDDMRLNINPAEITPAFQLYREHESDQCMEGVFDYLFLTNVKH